MDDNNCANADVSGPGVVASFIISAVLTTLCSVVAAVLDGMILEETAVLPTWMQTRLHKGLSDRTIRRLRLWRETLDKLILSLADQQLLTGFCILISGFLLTSIPPYSDEGGTLNDNFTLVLCLSALSSSSHLASLITLKRYLRAHRTTTYLRTALIIIFALGLDSCILVDSHSPFSKAFYLILSEEAYDRLTTALPFSDDVTFGLLIIYTFYIGLVQLFLPLQNKIAVTARYSWAFLKKRIKYTRFTRFLSQRLVTGKPQPGMWTRFRCILRRIAWFFILGSPLEAFILQVLFAMASLAFLVLFRFTGIFTTCFVNDTDNNSWGFGQTLPMLLLLLPFWSAAGFYAESREKLRYEEAEGGDPNQVCCHAFNEKAIRVSAIPAVENVDPNRDLERAETDLGGMTLFNENMDNYFSTRQSAA